MSYRIGNAILLGCMFVVSFCLTTACTQADSPSDYLHLHKNEWVCTDNKVISFKPYSTECVTYRKLK